MDEPTLEFFVRDSFTAGVSDEECRRIVELLEPCRKIIERQMNDLSWRDFREWIWTHVPAEIHVKIAELILATPRICDRQLVDATPQVLNSPSSLPSAAGWRE